MKQITGVKAVGWDLDGTLYPPDSIPREVIEQLKWKRLQGEYPDKNFGELRKEYEALYTQLHSHTKTLTAMGINGVEFFTNVWDELALVNYIYKDERVVEMVRGMSAKGLVQFVLSNSNRLDQIEQKLTLIGFEPHHDFVFLLSTVEMGAVKPDPVPFLEALSILREKLGEDLTAAEVLYVGDRVKTDVEGARRVGMKTCLVWGASELADISCQSVYDVGELFS
jgi:FMN phosphatase YigB (HAD superfamily)